jgi:predicted phosphodiesterase
MNPNPGSKDEGQSKLRAESATGILFTSDLHLNIAERSPRTNRTAFDAFAEVVAAEDPETVVIAGDLGSPHQAEVHLSAIRKVVGDRRLVICLGNHDFWLPQEVHPKYSTLAEVVAAFWEKPAKDTGAILLDQENAVIGDIAIVGCYGHFDLGLGVPGLVIRGISITERIYLSGGMNGLVWKDFWYVPGCRTRLQAEARAQAAGLAERLDGAIAKGKRILVSVHTCPWKGLNGHPLTGKETDILAAYSGNSLIGKVLEERAGAVELLVCGHTHMPVREKNLFGIPSLNMGGDYGVFRGIIYTPSDRSIRWVGEPLLHH